MVSTITYTCDDRGSIPAQACGVWMRVNYSQVFGCLLEGTLNRDAVCVCMLLKLCKDIDLHFWPIKNLGVRKQANTQHTCGFSEQKYTLQKWIELAVPSAMRQIQYIYIYLSLIYSSNGLIYTKDMILEISKSSMASNINNINLITFSVLCLFFLGSSFPMFEIFYIHSKGNISIDAKHYKRQQRIDNLWCKYFIGNTFSNVLLIKGIKL